ncbi:hypothetical protein Pmani_013627 [Petrolisthes manimaculis]|uniref:Chitin-binding type-2 domain-containing protein n=1 Tax=Petrolisthes manimaculis TaxID=1843537 RepID=A0AAE1PUJ5_9EUCA|nr:hypothetical protein Pmani_013627 [Petrolisthes manimaculis]
MATAILSSLFLLLATLVCSSIQVCAPDCTGVDPGTLVRDPTDCTRYYACLSINGEMIPSDVPTDCPDGQYFNPSHTIPRCDPIETGMEGYCTNLCNPCVPDCRADNPGTVQPHTVLCNEYYVCLEGGHTLLETCPSENPYYDFRTGDCQSDNTLCYNYCDPCVPHCTYDGESVSDPLDCHSFYVCSPPNMAHFLCPSGLVYDPVTTQCGTFACNTLCAK